jgi:hypothetical protein
MIMFNSENAIQCNLHFVSLGENRFECQGMRTGILRNEQKTRGVGRAHLL